MPHILGVEKKGNHYFAHLDFHGKRYTPGRGFATAQEANTWRTGKRSELQRGIGLGSDVTFEEFAVQYLKRYADAGVSTSTFNTMETLVRQAIFPALASVKVRDITADRIARLRSGLLSRYSTQTVSMTMGVLKRILRQAVQFDIIDKNPAAGVDPIRIKRKEPQVLTPEQLMTLLSSVPPMARAVCALGGLAGLRRSEVFGLQWDDIDFVANTISINRQNYQCRIREPKSGSSRSTVPMLEELVVILKEWKLQSRSQKWVFRGRRRSDEPMTTNWLLIHWNELLDKCGLPHIRFHDLRHTFITIMLNKGIPLIDVKYLARHSSVVTTQKYAHRTPGHLEGVVKGVRVFDEGLRRMERRMTEVKNA